MFARLFGNYLIAKNYLTRVDVLELLTVKKNSPENATSFMDYLGKKLGNPQLVEHYLEEYQAECGWSREAIATLQKGDLRECIALFVNTEDEFCFELIHKIVYLFQKNIDEDVALGKAVLVTKHEFEAMACQRMDGYRTVFFGMSGNDNALLSVANLFAKEVFTQIDANSMDAICEFIGCINGKFATKNSKDDIELELQPPTFHFMQEVVADKPFFLIPLYTRNAKIEIVVALDNELEVQFA